MDIARIGGGETKQFDVEQVGAKAANLARMAALGISVPPAFVLPIGFGAAMVNGRRHAGELAHKLREGIAFLEKATGRIFGDTRRPLLVSVRSGAARSMPGMLDTVLDVGCTAAAVHGLVRMSGNPRFAWDCRRRFLESYGEVVIGIDKGLFAARRAALSTGVEIDSDELEKLSSEFQQVIEKEDE